MSGEVPPPLPGSGSSPTDTHKLLSGMRQSPLGARLKIQISRIRKMEKKVLVMDLSVSA